MNFALDIHFLVDVHCLLYAVKSQNKAAAAVYFLKQAKYASPGLFDVILFLPAH